MTLVCCTLSANGLILPLQLFQQLPNKCFSFFPTEISIPPSMTGKLWKFLWNHGRILILPNFFCICFSSGSLFQIQGECLARVHFSTGWAADATRWKKSLTIFIARLRIRLLAMLDLPQINPKSKGRPFSCVFIPDNLSPTLSDCKKAMEKTRNTTGVCPVLFSVRLCCVFQCQFWALANL